AGGCDGGGQAGGARRLLRQVGGHRAPGPRRARARPGAPAAPAAAGAVVAGRDGCRDGVRRGGQRAAPRGRGAPAAGHPRRLGLAYPRPPPGRPARPPTGGRGGDGAGRRGACRRARPALDLRRRRLRRGGRRPVAQPLAQVLRGRVRQPDRCAGLPGAQGVRGDVGVRTVLVTGFEPFAGAADNPSGDAVRRLARDWDGPERLVTEVRPGTFAAAAARVCALIDEHDPVAVVAVGLGEGRAELTPERVAVNLADARIPDNAGAQPVDEPVVAGGPAAYLTTAP